MPHCLHGSKWKRQNAMNEQQRKIIPKLVYLHNPWKYLVTKFNMWRLKWLWDYGFCETEFVEGSKQAAIVMTDIIRQQGAEQLSELTTPVGFQQITRDMLLSRNDTRLQLVRFEKEHIRRAIPMKVATRKNFGRKYAFIDMLFVGLRNTKDFDSPAELAEINDLLRRMDIELKTPHEIISVPHRIVFAEIFIRFRRDYTAEWRRKQDSSLKQNDAHSLEQTESSSSAEDLLMGRILSRLNDPGWSVSFYKILTFDVLNFDPKPNRRF
ncbi:GH22570 [Drosophila grimshawi]|uniref:GH22570 n=1 Tax=Drosophila grimshawi TaxID=7222 RepID=B4K1V2_DROGR|nr:GH22570 [Drosophila grimshawi]